MIKLLILGPTGQMGRLISELAIKDEEIEVVAACDRKDIGEDLGLLIGVKDDGSVQGLEYDFKLSDRQNVRDFFLLEFDNMIKHFLSFSNKSNIDAQFYSLDGKEIFVVMVNPNIKGDK